MIVAVTGWREYTDEAFIRRHLEPWRTFCLGAGRILHVRVGDAPGADAMVLRWCLEHRDQVSCRVFRANWDKYGKRAGPVRNEQMLRGIGDMVLGPTNVLLAFPRTDGARIEVPGSGTLGCVIKAFELGIKVEIVFYRKETR